MPTEKSVFFLFVFVLLCAQSALSFIQIKRYQKTVKEMVGSGILGIGQRKALTGGELLILSYDRKTDKIIKCRAMKGITVFASFKDITEYEGISLNEIRGIAIGLDAKQLGAYRKKHPYDPKVLSKKKGALIQAVEAIDLRIKDELGGS